MGSPLTLVIVDIFMKFFAREHLKLLSTIQNFGFNMWMIQSLCGHYYTKVSKNFHT